MITQRELISEGFWDKFRHSGLGRTLAAAGTAAKEVGKIVLPKTTQAIKSVTDQWDKSSDRVAASFNPKKALTKFLADSHDMYPVDLKNIKVGRNSKGETIYVLDVTELHIDDNGNEGPLLINGRSTYSIPRVMVLMNKEHDFKMIKTPTRSRSYRQQLQNQSQNPP